MSNERTKFEQLLDGTADQVGDPRHTAVIRWAVELLTEQRRAVELSRVWWDDKDIYRAPWNHKGFPCDVKPCAACQARSAAMLVLEKGLLP